jgi:hypothetical protein
MTTLLLAEVHGGKLNDATAKALTAASQISAPVHVLVAGGDEAAQAAAKLQGVEKVLTVSGEAFSHGLAEPLADLIVSLAQNYDAIVAPATSTGKNVLPRVAALLDVAQVSEISKGDHGANLDFRRCGRGRIGADRSGNGFGRERVVELQERGSGEIGPSGADLGEDHHLGRPGDAERRELQGLHRAYCRQARRGDGGVAGGGGRRLCAQ